MSMYSSRDSMLLDTMRAPPSTGENQTVTLLTPELTPVHAAVIHDVLRQHLVKKLRTEKSTKVIGGLHEVAEYIDHAVVAILGGYGAGKTSLASLAFEVICLMNGKHEGYGGDHPRAFAVAPTSPVLHDTAIHRIMAITPPALIAATTKSPWSLTFVNGCVVAGKSADGALEGFEGCCLYAEEIQHENYWRDAMLWPNYVARIRDPHATVRRVIVAGLPTSGSVRAQFDKPGIRLHQLPTSSNPAIDEATMETIRQACPMGQENSLLGGDWMQPQGAVFATFNAAKHIVPTGYDPKVVTSFAIDVGNHSAAVLYQEQKVKSKGITGQTSLVPGLLVVDDLVTHGKSVEDLCIALRTREIQPSEACDICMDPTVRADERAVIRKYFPQATIVQLTKDDPYYYIEEGIRLMQTALGDAFGNVRLHVLEHCRRTRNGVITALQSARRNPTSGEVRKDDRTDHARDALRYATCRVLGKRQGPKVLQ